MTRGPKGTDSFPVPPPNIYDGPDTGFFGIPDETAEKSSMDKLIDINHHLMRRVEELEGRIERLLLRKPTDPSTRKGAVDGRG